VSARERFTVGQTVQPTAIGLAGLTNLTPETRAVVRGFTRDGSFVRLKRFDRVSVEAWNPTWWEAASTTEGQ
jgi:hypothetical protein